MNILKNERFLISRFLHRWMSPKYSLVDVVKSYNWLGHDKGYTELNAYHPDYRPGDYGWNVKNKTWPKIWYARKEQDVVKFVEMYADRTVCFGINPRPQSFKTEKGYPRAARDEDIVISQNLLLDFDIEGKPSKDRLLALRGFLEKAQDDFSSADYRKPVLAYTGRGFHLLFAYPPMRVDHYPDISQRLKKFRDDFANSYWKHLSNLEVKLDATQDLRRMVKIYGTAKPEVGIISRFYGDERVEDEYLLEHLLRMEIASRGPKVYLDVGDEIPDSVANVLRSDSEIKQLWEGKGKPQDSDTSRTGYDYSLVKRLLRTGVKNLDDLATVLALRPEGAVKQSGKDERYILRTIGNALLK